MGSEPTMASSSAKTQPSSRIISRPNSLELHRVYRASIGSRISQHFTQRANILRATIGYVRWV
ncbi:predicted protein [Plenodomus lingam JN3]|uniref:Predicted protein n=1 Tax=Leptosphaeria maculans (strain JN3 / isolate v23.1.3 / race Av1-4-5-6-7-8) TaxID=985895 RepID=E5A5F5_LEPMJ|nr:predicted protein [Plenodomus lingam JN3]CBX98853.1 predicted protein [Plenodomus lingam JN3]